MGEPFSLRFSSLEIQEAGGLEVSRSLAPEALASLGVDAAFAGPVALQAEFSVGGKELLFLGSARGRVAAECSRCLARAEAPFEAALEQTYELAQPDVDVAPELREALLLALPGKVLCRPDCKGLCPRCGQNLNERDCGHRPETPKIFGKLKPSQEKRT